MFVPKVLLVLAAAVSSTTAVAVSSHNKPNIAVNDVVNSTTAIESTTAKQAEIGCTYHAIDPNDLAMAIFRALDFCRTNGPLSNHTKYRFVEGQTMAYVCNYGGQNPCQDPQEWQDALDHTELFCGFGQSGYVYEGDWKKTYGFDDAAAGYCDNLKYPRGEAEA
ncbi:hypothetical protein QBC46DRAFT_156700 [Diplogelasinospora grovesii]|uniref:Uncharacterized protein n=1 Tax=Diplogelasinospora grovesii TaxID=303347 RepID=A0AAN6NIA7_9PEZI|nr:hypothetical protein QBC46DRAFT_156700 [Diplogelasinospora grovesii]